MNAVIHTSLNLNDSDSIPNGALNINRINIAFNSRYNGWDLIQGLALNANIGTEYHIVNVVMH